MVRLTAYNLATVFFAGTGGFTYGYGFGVFVSSVGYPGFYTYFGLDRKCRTSYWIHEGSDILN
jgi:hypothetical protein